MKLAHLEIVPLVVDMLGGEHAARAATTHLALDYRCYECHRPGHADAHMPASVLLLVVPEGRRVLRLAHPACSDSGVRFADCLTTTDLSTIWPARAMFRPQASPAATILISLYLGPVILARNGDMVDLATANLLADGFWLLTDPDTDVPELPGLTVRLGPGEHVTVRGDGGLIVYDQSLPVPPGWVETVTTAGRVAVIVTTGMDLYNPGWDHDVDLRAAIRVGFAVGATARLDPGGDAAPLHIPQPSPAGRKPL